MSEERINRIQQGSGGLKYINMPGVKYPEKVLKGPGKPGSTRSNPLREVPPGYVSSVRAAEMLKVSVRSARAMLSRHKVPRVMVREPRQPVRAYWEEQALEILVAERAPLVEDMPDRFCSAHEACCLLSVARSSLTRYVKCNLLREVRVRMASENGVRIESYFERAAVRRMAVQREILRRRVEQIRRGRLARQWEYYLKRRGIKESES